MKLCGIYKIHNKSNNKIYKKYTKRIEGRIYV